MSIRSTLARLEQLVEKKGLQATHTNPLSADRWKGVSDEQLDIAIEELRAGKRVSDPAVQRAIDDGKQEMAWLNDLDEAALDQMIVNLTIVNEYYKEQPRDRAEIEQQLGRKVWSGN